MRRLFLAFALICASFVSAAAKSVVFTLNDGTLVYYLLNSTSKPVLKFVDGGVTVNADNYAFSQIKNFYISNTDDPNAIKDVESETNMQMQSNTLYIKGENASTVSVFTVGGAKVDAETRVEDGRLAVSLEGLAKGIYIINTGSASFRVMKK